MHAGQYVGAPLCACGQDTKPAKLGCCARRGGGPKAHAGGRFKRDALLLVSQVHGARGARAGQELRDDARLLREARLADLSVVQAVPTAQANAFSAPPPEQAAALAAASPATLLAAEVRP